MHHGIMLLTMMHGVNSSMLASRTPQVNQLHEGGHHPLAVGANPSPVDGKHGSKRQDEDKTVQDEEVQLA